MTAYVIVMASQSMPFIQIMWLIYAHFVSSMANGGYSIYHILYLLEESNVVGKPVSDLWWQHQLNNSLIIMCLQGSKLPCKYKLPRRKLTYRVGSSTCELYRTAAISCRYPYHIHTLVYHLVNSILYKRARKIWCI